jgi:hypothetical protein
VIGLDRIVPPSWQVQGANLNLTIRSKYKDAAEIMAMHPAILEHVMSNVIQGSLNGKLKAIACSPYVWYIVVLARDCSIVGEHFGSTTRLLDPSIWMTLNNREQYYLAKLK